MNVRPFGVGVDGFPTPTVHRPISLPSSDTESWNDPVSTRTSKALRATAASEDVLSKTHPAARFGRDGNSTFAHFPCRAMTGSHVGEPTCVTGIRATGRPPGSSRAGSSRSGWRTIPLVLSTSVSNGVFGSVAKVSAAGS